MRFTQPSQRDEEQAQTRHQPAHRPKSRAVARCCPEEENNAMKERERTVTRPWLLSSISGLALFALAATPTLAAHRPRAHQLRHRVPATTGAQATTGNGAPSGPHYNLNIIGV